MEIGFETIGNATLVCHDRIPVLVTDPWLTGGAYFGSWGLSNAIPEETMASIKQCPYVWISHGHPDHLSPRSLDLLAGKEILLADHVGGIIRQGLSERGFQVRVLRDREWTPLSERVRIMSIADYNQDGILLVEMNGRLIVDLNDADRTGWDPRASELLPAFIRYDLERDSLEEINPPANRQKPLAPEHFGDSWDEPLAAEDKIAITDYFGSISRLHNFLDFICVRIGGVEHTVELNSTRFNRGLTFEAPRHSFMTAIEYESFDDLLVGI